MPSVEPVKALRRAGEQGRFLACRTAGGKALKRVPEHLIAAAALIDREVTLEHCALDAKRGNAGVDIRPPKRRELLDRKSTRLNSSHMSISYAVFCLKKKKIIIRASTTQYPTRRKISWQTRSSNTGAFSWLSYLTPNTCQYLHYVLLLNLYHSFSISL